MKRTILATCLAGACAVALSAQTPTQQTPPTAGTTGTTTSQDTGGQRSRPMTISGCLKAGDTPGTYKLTNVKAMGRTSGAAGTTGETTAGGATTGGATTTTPESGAGSRGMNEVALTATASDVDLSKHVGHQIEVTGTPQRGGAGTTGGTTAGGTTGGTTTGDTTAGTSGRTPRSLNVTSVKMVSDSCPQ